jgi:hypothetical protein
MKPTFQTFQTSSYYRFTDVEAIRRMLYPPWYKRLNPYLLAGLFVGMAVWALLILGYLHRTAVIGWFQQLGYWQWTALLILAAVLVMLGHYVYRKGRS